MVFSDEDMNLLKDEIDKLDAGLLSELLPDLLERLKTAEIVCKAAEEFDDTPSHEDHLVAQRKEYLGEVLSTWRNVVEKPD